MNRNVQRDFVQLRDHLHSLSDVRDGFVAGPTRSQNVSFQLVPIVWNQSDENEPDLKISAISSDFVQVALFTAKAPAEREIEIRFERFDPKVRDEEFLNGLTDLVY